MMSLSNISLTTNITLGSTESNSRGIIIAIMEKYEYLLVSNIRFLREKLNCILPIELWQIGQEISNGAMEYLDSYKDEWKLSFKNVNDYTDNPKHWQGYQIKPFILKNTQFKEVILCDCDTVFLTNPEIIFDDDRYKNTGTFFFKDYLLHTPKKVEDEIARKKFFRKLMPIPSKYLPEECYYLYDIPTEMQQLWYYQESGVVYINKTMHSDVIETIYELNNNHKETYKYVHGDKETFWMAFLMHDKPFYMNLVPGLNLMPYLKMPRIRGPIKDDIENLVPAFTHIYTIGNKYIPLFSQKAYPDYEHVTNERIFNQLKKCPYYANLFIGSNALSYSNAL